MSFEIKLREVLESEINTILENITEENYPPLYEFIEETEPNNVIYFLQYEIFESLVNKFCYEPENQNYYPLKEYVPESNLELFREVFLKNMDFSSYKSIEWYHNTIIYSEERLYTLLFYYLFTQFISTKDSIEMIFNQALKDWKSALESKKMPIYIDLLLHDTQLIDSNELIISEDLSLKYYAFYKTITGNDLLKINHGFHHLGVILRLFTSQSFNHNFHGEMMQHEIFLEDANLSKEFQMIISRIQEFLLCLYLFDFKADLKGFVFQYPWWIKNEIKNFEMPGLKFEINKLTPHRINQIILLYKEVQKHNIVKDPELELALFNYFQLQSRVLLSELILMDFIILENIFTRKSETELSFRLALNSSLFISKTREEMLNLFEFMKFSYGIRSKIIHGSKWYKSLKKKKVSYLLGLDSSTSKEKVTQAIHERLLSIINRSVIKIINLKIERYNQNKNYDIMSEVKGLYFLLNSSFFSDTDNKE